jgi:hypothetical protein
MLRVVGVDDPAESFCEGRNDRVDDADFIHPSGGVRALLTRSAEEFAGSKPVRRQHRLRPKLR